MASKSNMSKKKEKPIGGTVVSRTFLVGPKELGGDYKTLDEAADAAKGGDMLTFVKGYGEMEMNHSKIIACKIGNNNSMGMNEEKLHSREDWREALKATDKPFRSLDEQFNNAVEWLRKRELEILIHPLAKQMGPNVWRRFFKLDLDCATESTMVRIISDELKVLGMPWHGAPTVKEAGNGATK